MGILRDNNGSMGGMQKKAYQENCKPDYEKQIATARARQQAAIDLQGSLLYYLGVTNKYHRVSEGFIVILGELELENALLEHTINELIEAQAKS